MTIDHLIEAIVFGTVEGLTEFLPVSSTGHLLLLGHFLGAGEGPGWKTFVVLIQLGAILAIMTVYFSRLLKIALTIPTDPGSRRFVLGILIAFLPAVVIGAGLHGVIKNIFFESPKLICISLLVGGFVLLGVDRFAKAPRHDDVAKYPMPLYLLIGLCQTLAMIPGVSRSGATIAGAVMMGTSKRSAAEFSFFLAIPTMVAAFAYDLLKSYKDLDLSDAQFIAVGFFAAFVAGVIVVKIFLEIVSRYGFAPFAYYRIVAGTLGLIAIYTVTPGHLAKTVTEAPVIVVPVQTAAR